MVLAVGVVEGFLAALACIEAILDVDFRLAVVQADGVGVDISLEGSAVFGHGIGIEGRCILLGLDAELHSVAVFAGGEALSGAVGQALVGALVYGVGREVFLLQGSAVALDGHSAAEVAAAQIHAALGDGHGAQQGHVHGHVGGVGGQSLGIHLEAGRCGQRDLVGQVGGIYGKCTALACAVDYHALSLSLGRSGGYCLRGAECHHRPGCIATQRCRQRQ